MSPVKVMIVDDEVPFVQTIMKRLTKRDLQVVAAYSGPEALDILASDQDIDIVILDVKMPEMDGIETLREIKKSHPLVEVIMLTGHATVESAVEGMRLGAYDYLTKPCDMEEVIKALASAAAKKATHEEKIFEAQIREMALKRGD